MKNAGIHVEFACGGYPPWYDRLAIQEVDCGTDLTVYDVIHMRGALMNFRFAISALLFFGAGFSLGICRRGTIVVQAPYVTYGDYLNDQLNRQTVLINGTPVVYHESMYKDASLNIS